MLNVSALSASHGAVRALRAVTLTAGAGAFTALLGGNGAGKSTLLHCIAGLHRPAAGSIQFRGGDLLRLSPHRIIRRGIALVPASPPTLAGLSVAENLSLGGLAGRGRESRMLERALALFPALGDRLAAPAAELDRDQRQMLAVARAVMLRPRALLLDEPTRGLSPEATDLMLAAIVTLRDDGVSILLAEQNAAAALSLCDYAYVFKRGTIVAQGKPVDLRESPTAMEAFLG